MLPAVLALFSLAVSLAFAVPIYWLARWRHPPEPRGIAFSVSLAAFVPTFACCMLSGLFWV